MNTPLAEAFMQGRMTADQMKRLEAGVSAFEQSPLWDSRLNVRDVDGGHPAIEGYAAIFNTLSRPLRAGSRTFREQVMPGAFRSVLDPKNEVLALLEHDFRNVLGRRSRGTLSLEEDGTGLRSTVIPGNTTLGRDLIESVRRGDIEGMSFRFNRPTDQWSKASDGSVIRTIVNFAEVSEVSFTSMPAYPATTATIRSLENPEVIALFEDGEPGDSVRTEGPDLSFYIRQHFARIR